MSNTGQGRTCLGCGGSGLNHQLRVRYVDGNIIHISSLLIILQDPKKQGYYQSPFIVEMLAYYFGLRSIHTDPTAIESMPVGALAFIAAAVSTVYFSS
jgi:hypothetical protein